MDIVTREEEDPFLEADRHLELQGLIDSGCESCMLEEYVHGDNDLPVYADLDSDTWDAAFLSNLGEDGEEDEDGEDMDNHEE